jgi:hypothetical protein
VTYRSIAGEVVARPSSRASAGSRDLAWFVLLVAMAHAITYFLVGPRVGAESVPTIAAALVRVAANHRGRRSLLGDRLPGGSRGRNPGTSKVLCTYGPNSARTSSFLCSPRSSSKALPCHFLSPSGFSGSEVGPSVSTASYRPT